MSQFIIVTSLQHLLEKISGEIANKQFLPGIFHIFKRKRNRILGKMLWILLVIENKIQDSMVMIYRKKCWYFSICTEGRGKELGIKWKKSPKFKKKIWWPKVFFFRFCKFQHTFQYFLFLIPSPPRKNVLLLLCFLLNGQKYGARSSFCKKLTYHKDENAS